MNTALTIDIDKLNSFSKEELVELVRQLLNSLDDEHMGAVDMEFPHLLEKVAK